MVASLKTLVLLALGFLTSGAEVKNDKCKDDNGCDKGQTCCGVTVGTYGTCKNECPDMNNEKCKKDDDCNGLTCCNWNMPNGGTCGEMCLLKEPVTENDKCKKDGDCTKGLSCCNWNMPNGGTCAEMCAFNEKQTNSSQATCTSSQQCDGGDSCCKWNNEDGVNNKQGKCGPYCLLGAVTEPKPPKVQKVCEKVSGTKCPADADASEDDCSATVPAKSKLMVTNARKKPVGCFVKGKKYYYNSHNKPKPSTKFMEKNFFRVCCEDAKPKPTVAQLKKQLKELRDELGQCKKKDDRRLANPSEQEAALVASSVNLV